MKPDQNSTKVHIEELLEVFQNIDLRIRELHQNSSLVFMQLNDFLKDYFKKNQIVSGNATKIFDTIAGNNESCLICELNNIFEKFENYKEGTDNELNTNLYLCSQLNNKSDNLSLLFRNFKQDLITFKLLITNYRIISHNKGFDKKSLKSVLKWENTITNIYSKLTEIGNDTTKVSNSLGDLYKKTKTYSHSSVNKNSGLYEELKSSISLINNKNLESKNYIPVLKEKIKSSSESIENIITHLQYHDIIRQKIEHIQKSHILIITSLKEDHSRPERELIREDDDIISLIADISGLQAAQLILISKEYQKALEVISDNFLKIADDLTTVSTVSHEFSYETANSETTLIKLMKERLDKSLLLLDEYNSNSFNQDLLKIKQQISDLHKNTYQHIIEPIEKTKFPHISPEVNLKTKIVPLEGQPNIFVLIDLLARDIIEKKDELCKELSDVIELSDKFPVETGLNGFRSKLEEEQIRIMVCISKTLGRLDYESKQLDSVLIQNCSIKKDIISRLKETLNQADYYELFEKVLSIIIEQLNAINGRLRSGSNYNDKSDKVRNLKEIETFYTVSSERIVHQKVINEDTDINLPDHVKTEEDIELF